MFKKRVKIPRIPMEYRHLTEDNMGGIEISHSTDSKRRGVSLNLPAYEIKARTFEGESGERRYLADISVLPTKGKKGGSRAYNVYANFRNLGRPNSYFVGKKDNLGNATFLAHNAAVKLAGKIADVNNLPLEDRVSEDEKELEDEKLAREIDSLPFRKGRITIFTLSIIAGLALSINTFTATGNTISNVAETTQGLLGIIFFIVGLTGLFFSLRGKKTPSPGIEPGCP